MYEVASCVRCPMNDMPPPNQYTYVRLTVVHMWENLPLVLVAALVFTLLCTPVFLLSYMGSLVPALIVGALTIAPAWAALLAQEGEILRDVGTDIRVMFKALRRYWPRCAGLGLLAVVPLLAGLLTLPGLAESQMPAVVWIGLGADAFGLLLLAALYLYAFPLIVLRDMKATTAVRNALILSSRHISNTIGLLGMGFLFSLATLYVSSGLLLIMPAVWGMFIVNNCRMVMAEELEEAN